MDKAVIYPTVDDGVKGVAFVEACVASSKKNGGLGQGLILAPTRLNDATFGRVLYNLRECAHCRLTVLWQKLGATEWRGPMKSSARLLTCAFALAALPAWSQEVPNRVPNFYAGQRIPGTVNVQTTVSLSVPVDAGQELADQIKVAQKGFYLMAGGQCDLVLETLAETCQITNLTNSADLNRGSRNDIIVRGTVTMAVKLKDSPQKP